MQDEAGYSKIAMLEALEIRLSALLPASAPGPARLTAAQRYTLLLPGKRVRGLLALMVTQSWGQPWQKGLDLAAALEMVHAASLIIDDLPCMDDAALRRGAPSAHVEFGEATATLAAIGLMNHAFSVVAADAGLSADQRIDAVAALATAIGPAGLTGGQEEDVNGPARATEDIERVHAAKTGALFVAAAALGTIAGGVGGAPRQAMADFGLALGNAFQAFDDLIDVLGNAATAGKPVGQDAGRSNLAGATCVDSAIARAEGHLDHAIKCLEASGAAHDRIAAYVGDIVDRLRKDAGGLAPRRSATRP
ncbi:MAG: polyprenyl synthetase family protein [Hyphomicrobiaceae bacterium]